VRLEALLTELSGIANRAFQLWTSWAATCVAMPVVLRLVTLLLVSVLLGTSAGLWRLAAVTGCRYAWCRL